MSDSGLDNPFKMSTQERRRLTLENIHKLKSLYETSHKENEDGIPSTSVRDACKRYIEACEQWEKEHESESLNP
jgi:hypothetical protein